MDGKTSVDESKELSAEPNKCECIEAETGYSELTGKFAWQRKKKICTNCANSSLGLTIDFTNLLFKL